MTVPKDIEQFFVGNFLRVIADLNALGVISYAVIGRIVCSAPRVADAGANDAV
jgi:hypothetical protein